MEATAMSSAATVLSVTRLSEEGPADDFMREGIGQQVEVRHALIRVDISDVRHPQPVESGGDEAFCHILVFTVVMIGIGSMTASLGLEHEMALVHQAIEAVATAHFLGIQFFEHQEQLIGAQSGSTPADVFYRPDYLIVGQLKTQALFSAHAIITLAAFAKQSAQHTDGDTGMLEPKGIYCLAPVFLAGQHHISHDRCGVLH